MDHIDFKVSDDLYLVTVGVSKGKIYFNADSFYGFYTVEEFQEFLFQLTREFQNIRSSLTKISEII